MHIRQWVAVAVILLGTGIGQALAIDHKNSVEGLLAQMAEAGHALNYRGVFTYEYAGALKVVRIVHAVKNGVEFEHLSHLNGVPQEVIRQGNPVDCRRVGDVLFRGAALGASKQTYGHLANYYNLFQRGEDRIANRTVAVVHLVPKDGFRYGYILAVDKETSLLLQLILVGGGDRALERFQYTDIEIGVPVSDSELRAGQANNYVAEMDGQPCDDIKASVSPQFPSNMVRHTSWIPPGFVLARADAETGQTTQSALYTDGLAAFSLFIDSTPPEGVPVIQAQRGATVAHLTRVNLAGKPYNICIVGEIPKLTAQRIAESVRLVP